MAHFFKKNLFQCLSAQYINGVVVVAILPVKFYQPIEIFKVAIFY